jgi:hypothetical protein
MINYNGTLCETIEQLEELISNLSEEQKQFVRNDFNGVVNAPVINSVPVSVTNRQIREAMTIMSYQTGNPTLHPDNILLFLKALPASIERDITIQNWEYSNDFIRANPLINQMAPVLGLTSEDLDNLFILAATRGI